MHGKTVVLLDSTLSQVSMAVTDDRQYRGLSSRVLIFVYT